jgi:glycosyltransferase involved in cell wall biosynthesis
MKTVFIGHFSPTTNFGNPAASAAGDQVQRQIIKELQDHTCGDTIIYSMSPIPAWPRGELITRSQHENAVEYIGYLNAPVLKHLVFSVRLMMRLFRSRPALCIQYNSYFFENLILLLFRLFRPACFLATIIQDIHIEKGIFQISRRGLRSLSERLSLGLSRSFDLIVPISSSIITDFKFDPSRCFVFQGGITAFAAQLMYARQGPLADIGVFAGALEPYNGIDRLINQWLTCGIEHTLHVFGRGSLKNHVEQAAKCSDKIVFHGLQPEEIILQWQLKARWNFCLRYSEGLNQEYFFPSKLFNVVCAPGAVIGNDFYALPSSLREHMGIVSDDLSDLPSVLTHAAKISSLARLEERREIVKSKHNWRSCIDQIVKIATFTDREIH